MIVPHRFRSRAFAGAIGLVAFANAPLPSVAGTVSCNIPQPCALYSNAQGPGLSGTSAKSEGLVGTTTFAGTTTSNRTYGVEGVDGSTNKSIYNVGVYGTSPYGLGVYGISPSGTGVYGTTTSGFGVRATASSGTAVSGASSSGNGILGTTAATSTSTMHAAVTGNDLSKTNGTRNDGVLGTVTNGGYGVEGRSSDGAEGGVLGGSTTGIGVTGRTSSDIAVYGDANTGYAMYGFSDSGTGIYGATFGSGSIGVEAFSGSGPAMTATTDDTDGIDVSTGGNVGVRVNNTNGNGTDVTGSYIALLGRSNNYPLVLTNTSGNDLFQVDGNGNVTAAGSYGTYVKTREGRSVTAFTAQSTAANVEDTGTARLVDGMSTVVFDPAFGSTIDARTTYQVFLTPGGDTRGLFVAAKTARGFVVRETQGGRGTLAFDYRVVATALGRTHDRMALVSASHEAIASPVRAMPKTTRPQRPAVRTTAGR